MNHHPHPKQAIYEGCAIQENGPPTLGHCMDRHDKNKSMHCNTIDRHLGMLYKTTLHCELPILWLNCCLVMPSKGKLDRLIVESLCCITESPPLAMNPVSPWQFCRADCRSSRRCSAHA
mmetsp:Transcript_29162/g.54604  ORF Transcript_29162/g.54604 Transcript_29162/m.54604 type:complete len:119 (+) Transcript_29162:39-395(+)